MILHELAQQWVKRRDALGYKGKRGDRLCFEYFMGAGSALELSKHPDAGRVLLAIPLVLAVERNMQKEVDRWAAGGEISRTAKASLTVTD